MQRNLIGLASTIVLTCAIPAGSVEAQFNWPIPPANWWTDLDAGDYPSATFEMNMGMSMTITQSIETVSGTQITVSTAMSMMGNSMPGQSQVIDAATMTPAGAVEMIQSFGGLEGNQMTPEEARAAMEAMVSRIESTTCRVGGLELDCTLYEIVVEETTNRLWHAPAIPPVFMGGVVRLEATMGDQTFETTMTSYSGALLN